jgi:hypothetical protein
MVARINLFLPCITLICASFLGCRGGQWEPLFSGKDLEGWTVKCLAADQGKSYWRVEDGCISCNSLGDSNHNYVWLCTVREFTDFHLKLKFQVFRESSGNSGVQFRSRYDDSSGAIYGGWLHGPQVDIHGPEPFRTGLIYDETEGIRRWIHPSLPDWKIGPEQAPLSALDTKLLYFEDDPNGWNSMDIKCRRMFIITRINGKVVSDFNGEGILNDKIHRNMNSGESGCIALQLHMHDELNIRFKDILIKEFTR